jgi:hypothetical protein
VQLTISASGSRQQAIDQLTRLQQSSEADGLGGTGGKVIAAILEHVQATPESASGFSVSCSINVSYSKLAAAAPPAPPAGASAK